MTNTTQTANTNAPAPRLRKPSDGISMAKSSVNLSTGAHRLCEKLASVTTGQKISFSIHYDSSALVEGCIGRGWYHNFEKHLEIDGYEIYLYETPSIYAKYTTVDGINYTCTSPDRNGYVITRRTQPGTANPYVLNRNGDGEEEYGNNGALARIISREGYIISLNSDDDGRITRIVDIDFGGEITLIYGENGRLSDAYDNEFGLGDEVTDDYEDVRLAYDANGLLASVADYKGNEMTFTYENGRIKKGTDREGITYFENTYDTAGRLATQKDAEGRTTSFAYTSSKTTVTDRCGKAHVYEYDANGMLIAYTDPLTHKTTYEYDARCNCTKETDPLTRSITRTFNSFNKPLTVTARNGYTTTYTYDARGNCTMIDYPVASGTHNYNVTREYFTYNPRNLLTSHTDLRGKTVYYTYGYVDEIHEANDLGPRVIRKALSPAETLNEGELIAAYTYAGGRLATETDVYGNVTSYEYDEYDEYDENGEKGEHYHRCKVTDKNGNETAYAHDVLRNPAKFTNAANETTEKAYNKNSLVTSITDARTKTTTYTYDNVGRSKTVTEPTGAVTLYEYDGEGRVTKTTQKESATATGGRITTYEYNDAGWLVKKTLPNGGIETYEYDAAGNRIKTTDACGGITTVSYNESGQPTFVTDPAGTRKLHSYDAMGRLVAITGVYPDVTSYRLNAAGDLMALVDPNGRITSYTYDQDGNCTSVTDPNGNTTTMTYDLLGRKIKEKNPLNGETIYTYDAMGNCLSVTDPLGNTTTYEYDVIGRQVKVTDAKGRSTETLYQKVDVGPLSAPDYRLRVTVMGPPAAGSSSKPFLKSTLYDALGRVETVTNAAQIPTTCVYNGFGEVAEKTQKMFSQEKSVAYTYNEVGLPTEVLDPMNGVSETTYDLLGRPICVEGPGGAQTTYTYNGVGNVLTKTTPSGGTVTCTYGERNLKATETNARGEVANYYRDIDGTLMARVTSDVTLSYSFDGNGNLNGIYDDYGSTERTFDACNRRISQIVRENASVNLISSIGYEYDACGNLTKLIYPDNTAVTYEYDAVGNLTKVTDWANRTTTYDYDDLNRVKTVTKPDGSVTTNTYNNKQQLTKTETKTAGGTLIVGYEYTYDAFARIVEEKALANQTKLCYTYDDLDRILDCTLKNANTNVVLDTDTFTYDAASNLTSISVNSGLIYDANNRLISFSGSSTTFDADGNLTAWGNDTYTYDSLNRLTAAKGHTYTYDAEHSRLSNVTATTNIKYVYDTNAELSRLLQKTENGVVTKYVYGHGLIGEESGNTFKTYHFDLRGSTVAITDMSGNVTDTFAYDVYGARTSRTGTTPVIFGYNGRDGVVTDANGLLYMRARYYSPTFRRFLNADILAGSMDSSPTLNRYAYANGNPVMNVDPLGLMVTRDGGISYTPKTALEKLLFDFTNSIVIAYKETVKGLSESFNIVATFSDTVVNTAVESGKKQAVIQYDVPAYAQGNRNLCWAYSQTMIESYHSGGCLTQEEADERAWELALERNKRNPNKGAFPTNAGIPIYSHDIFSLYWTLQTAGPVYAYYSDLKFKDPHSHLVVVTGVDLIKGTVYTNNPWYTETNEQTYLEFLSGVYGADFYGSKYEDMKYQYLIPTSKEGSWIWDALNIIGKIADFLKGE